MKLIKLTSAVMALAFTATLGSSSAYAQANDGDLILGFQSTSSTNVYEVDLGAASQFIGVSSPLTFDLSTSDLSGTQYGFGSSWATSTSNPVQWGLISATSASSGTLFTSWNTFASAPAARTHAQQGSIGTDVIALYNDFNNSTTVTPGSTVSLPAGSDQTSDVDSFAYLENNAPNFKFGTGVNASQLDYNSDDSVPAADAGVLDLYELTDNGSSGTEAGDLLGTFSLASNGDLTFTAESVPEPSSWVLLGLGGLALVWNVRRRNQNSSAV
jgi:hypothetical protein